MTVGREKEQTELLRRYRGNRAEFIAVYGRRRVGKTFLIDETFRDIRSNEVGNGRDQIFR